jgi:hypothetical protein
VRAGVRKASPQTSARGGGNGFTAEDAKERKKGEKRRFVGPCEPARLASLFSFSLGVLGVLSGE